MAQSRVYFDDYAFEGGVNQNLFDRFRSDHFIEGRNCRHKVKRVFVFVLFFQEA